jgi:hypothetical protein
VDVRRLVEGRRPSALDGLGLAAACTRAVERLTAEAALAASVHAGEDLPALRLRSRSPRAASWSRRSRRQTDVTFREANFAERTIAGRQAHEAGRC